MNTHPDPHAPTGGGRRRTRTRAVRAGGANSRTAREGGGRMISSDRLEKLRQLQYKCKGHGKENLYHLIGMQGAPPDHEDLRRRLAKKRDSWSKIADKAAHLEIVEEALELLQTPSDTEEYDRFIRSPVEPHAAPTSPQTQPWGHDQPPMPPPPYHEQAPPPPRRAGLSINAKLGLVGLGLMALSLVMTVAGITPPETTRNTPTADRGTEDERAGAPAGPSSTNGERRSRSTSSAPDTSAPTTTDSGGRATPPRPEALGPPTVAPTSPGAAGDSSGNDGATAPASVEPSTTATAAPVAEPTAPAEPVTAPTAEPTVPARPDPPPVVEPVRVGGNVAQPPKTRSVQPEYPRPALRRGIEGIVILEVTVDRHGDVSDVAVLRSVEGLDEAAVEAARQWRYEPTIVDGRPVSVVLTETVRFQRRN